MKKKLIIALIVALSAQGIETVYAQEIADTVENKLETQEYDTLNHFHPLLLVTKMVNYPEQRKHFCIREHKHTMHKCSIYKKGKDSLVR